jgi:hypothetical protein
MKIIYIEIFIDSPPVNNNFRIVLPIIQINDAGLKLKEQD